MGVLHLIRHERVHVLILVVGVRFRWSVGSFIALCMPAIAHVIVWVAARAWLLARAAVTRAVLDAYMAILLH